MSTNSHHDQLIHSELATALGAALGDAKTVNSDHAYAVIPKDFKLEDLEKFQRTPVRIRETIKLGSVKSFADYVQRYATDATALFYDEKQPVLKAVIDYHTKGGPSWKDHVVELVFDTCDSWDTWVASNKKKFDQTEFAQFIEDNLVDIVRPSQADMLAISRTLEAKKNVTFASGIRLSNGETQFTYSEQLQGSAQNGKLEIPEEFVIGLAVFEGANPYEMRVRFRYRIDGNGKLTIWYDLYRHKDHRDLAAKAFIQQALESLKDITSFAIAK